jgi:hypothetical protein
MHAPSCQTVFLNVSFQAQIVPRTKTLVNDIQKLGRILCVNIERLQVSWREQYVVEANVNRNLSFYFYCL